MRRLPLFILLAILVACPFYAVGDSIVRPPLKTTKENAATTTTDSASGLEYDGGFLTMLQGCADNEILKWDETQDDWNCEAESGGSGDVTSVGDCTSGACLDGTSDGGTNFALFDGDSNKVTISSGNLSADITMVLPTNDGDNLQFLRTDGSGTLTWAAPSGSGDITSVGDCADGACFDGTQGTTLTFNNASGDQTLAFDNTLQDFSFSDDLQLVNAHPHLEVCDSTDGVAYMWHLDTAEVPAGLTLWRGTNSSCTAGFNIATTVPQLRFNADIMTIEGGVVINEAGSATGDVRIESDAEENMFVIDYSENTIGIGTALPDFHLDIHHKADDTGDVTTHIDHDMNSFPSTVALQIDLVATGMTAEEEMTGIVMSMNTADSSGGEIDGFTVVTVGTGTADAHALRVGADVEVIEQDSGTVGNVGFCEIFDDSGSSFTDCVTAANSASTDVQIFVEQNDFLYIGNSTQFSIITFDLAIGAGPPGIKPTFEHSITGDAFTAFGPLDTTKGMRESGVTLFDLDVISGDWVTATVDGDSAFWVRIKRTRNSISPVPTENLIQLATTISYEWDSSGNLLANTYSFEGATANAFEHKLDVIDPTADRKLIFPDDQLVAGDVLCASDASDLEYCGLTTTQIIIGDGSGIPTSAALSAHASMTNAGAVTIVDWALTADADAGDFDLDSLDRLEFLDAGLFIDGGTNGTLTLSSDGTLGISLGGTAGDDFTVDTNVLFVESDDNQVGINTTPTEALHVVGDVLIANKDPHIELKPDSGDSFEWYAHGGRIYLVNKTDSEIIFDFNGEDTTHTPTTNALKTRTAGFICPAGLSTDEDCEEIRTRIPANCTISQVFLSATTAPVGSALIVDINECTDPATCTTIDTGTKPQIADGAKEGVDSTFTDTTLLRGNYLGIDIDQVGSSTAGSDLTVTVVCIF